MHLYKLDSGDTTLHVPYTILNETRTTTTDANK